MHTILTARDEEQALRFRAQAADCEVIADLPGQNSGETTQRILQQNPRWESECLLIVHSGGESTRRPECARCGKAFQPYGAGTLLDAIRRNIGQWGIPPGVLITCGDVLYQAPQPTEIDAHAAVWGVPSTPEVAVNYGVLAPSHGRAEAVIQKPPLQFLIDNRISEALIDSGVWWLSAKVCRWLQDVDCAGNFYERAARTICRAWRPQILTPEGATWEHLG